VIGHEPLSDRQQDGVDSEGVVAGATPVVNAQRMIQPGSR
jgi:hypothetical protein